MRPSTAPPRIRLPFTWPGSKARQMSVILPMMPPHVHYVSAFGGTGADILRKPRSRTETFNDLNGDVVGFFRVLADPPSRRALLRRVDATPYSRREFEAAHLVLRSPEPDPVARAWAFVVSANQRRAGAAPDAARARPSSWGYGRAGGSPARVWPGLPDRLAAVAARFHGVQLECRPWDDILHRYDSPDTLFFLDPPYLPSTRVSPMYKHEMAEADHRRLLSAVVRLRGKVILTGYASPLYDEALSGWTATSAPLPLLVGGGSIKPIRPETIWTNFTPAAARARRL